MRQLIDLQEKKKRKKKREPLVPVGKSNLYLRVLFGSNKSGASPGSRTVAAEPKLPSVTIEILKNSVSTGSKIFEK